MGSLAQVFIIFFYGFPVIVRLLSGKAQNMADSKETYKYFSELVKPLATNHCLEEIISRLQDEIMSKYESKLEQQKSRIDELEGQFPL